MSECLSKNEIPLSVIGQICQDIKNNCVTNDLQVIGQMQWDSPLFLPVRVKTKTGYHVFLAVFFQNWLILANQDSTSQSGGTVYTLSQESIEKRKAVAHSVLSNTSVSSDKVKTTAQMVQYLKEQLLLSDHPIHRIPLSGQIAENCAMSSCAKMVVFTAIFCRIASALKALKQSDPLEKASLLTKIINRHWVVSDKLGSLQKYIAYYNNPNLKKYGPDKHLLWKIYLMTKSHKAHHQEIKFLIEKVQDGAYDALNEAYNALMKDVRSNLHLLATLLPKPPSWFENTQLTSEITIKIADLYIVQNRTAFESTLSTLMQLDCPETATMDFYKQFSLLYSESMKQARQTKKVDWLPSEGIVHVIDRLSRKKKH